MNDAHELECLSDEAIDELERLVRIELADILEEEFGEDEPVAAAEPPHLRVVN